MHKHSKKRIAIFFTLFYPYTHNKVLYDAYLLSEIAQLSANFDKVVVISASTDHDGQVDVPENVEVHNFVPDIKFADKLTVPLLFLKPFFRNELRNIHLIYKRNLNPSLFKAITAYATKAVKYLAFLDKLLGKVNFAECDAYVYCYWNFEYALAAALLGKKYPLKLIVRNHSLDLYFDRVPENYHPFRRYVYENSNLFIFISEQGKKYFFANHAIAPVLQHKAIINRIGSQNSLPGYTMPHNRIVLLSNAWIQPLKRIDLLINALALINNIDIEWIHVGDDYGTGRFPALKKHAADMLDNKPNISYRFAGRVTREELFDMYVQRKINLFINLSTTEGTPVSMMEAISFGVPVIGTRVGGVPEIIKDGFNGLLLPPEITAQDVADKIKEWYGLSGEQKNQLSTNAQKWWNDNYNADKNSIALLEQILAL
ncbi:MAG TPA: glycosyltransferase [Chitinophagales bacterium]|nr:glycosyltransferase [Chitinophagales bacterium]